MHVWFVAWDQEPPDILASLHWVMRFWCYTSNPRFLLCVVLKTKPTRTLVAASALARCPSPGSPAPPARQPPSASDPPLRTPNHLSTAVWARADSSRADFAKCMTFQVSGPQKACMRCTAFVAYHGLLLLVCPTACHLQLVVKTSVSSLQWYVELLPKPPAG